MNWIEKGSLTCIKVLNELQTLHALLNGQHSLHFDFPVVVWKKWLCGDGDVMVIVY